MGKMKHLWLMAQILQDIEDINQAKLDEIEKGIRISMNLKRVGEKSCI